MDSGRIRGVRVYLSRERADMRRSFDGLASMVDQQLDRDPLSGDLFVFRNKRGDRVKILYWDGDGLCVVVQTARVGCVLSSRCPVIQANLSQ